MKRICVINLLFVFFIATTGECSDSFKDESEDIKARCDMKVVKSINQTNCITTTFEGHDFLLNIYEVTRKGKFSITDSIKITSWYNLAKLNYDDLLGDSRNFFLIEFEGNTGTGVSQRILAIIGWHKGKFRPVLIEPISYYIDSKGLLTDLQVKYSISKIEKGVSVILEYEFIKETPDGIIRQNWRDILSWDNNMFVFYDKKSELEKYANSKIQPQKNIIKCRLNILDFSFDSANLDLAVLRRIGLLGILNDNAGRAVK